MIKKGTLPEGLPIENLKKEQLLSIQSGGKSVQELTGNQMNFFTVLFSFYKR